MKYFITIGIVLATLGGWYITYEPFGVVFPLDSEGNPPVNYWFWYDLAKSVPLFLMALWPFAGKLNIIWHNIALVLAVYFGLNLLGDIMGVNEKGNWFIYFYAAPALYIIALLLIPKRVYKWILTRIQKP